MTPLHGRASVCRPTRTYNSAVRTQDVVWKTCRNRWTIGTNGERVSGKSVLAICHDEDGIIGSGWCLDHFSYFSIIIIIIVFIIGIFNH